MYDPAVGHPLYHEYLDQLVLADRLGFDGLCVDEHHQNGHSVVPSPHLMASILARETVDASIVALRAGHAAIRERPDACARLTLEFLMS